MLTEDSVDMQDIYQIVCILAVMRKQSVSLRPSNPCFDASRASYESMCAGTDDFDMLRSASSCGLLILGWAERDQMDSLRRPNIAASLSPRVPVGKSGHKYTMT